MKKWSEITTDDRRSAFAREFRRFSIPAYQAYQKTRRSYKDVTIAWHFEAIKLAQTGQYYMRELTPILGKSPETVCVMFNRLRALKGTPGTGWPERNMPSPNIRLINADGKWRLEYGPDGSDVAPDPVLGLELQRNSGNYHVHPDGDREAVQHRA